MNALAEMTIAFLAGCEYDPSCEYGSVGTDPKRPFGNSDVEADILEDILKEEPLDGDYWTEEQRAFARELYTDRLPKFLEWLSQNSEFQATVRKLADVYDGD